jgi:hypothetical protein
MIKILAGWPRFLAQVLALAAALLAPALAQAFGPADAGIYAVYDNQGKQTDIAYRFYIKNEKWVAEERAADGSWSPFVCKENCEIKPMAADEVKRVFGSVLDLFDPMCISNGNFAVCNYIPKKEGAKNGYLMVVRTPDGRPVLVHIGLLATL